MSALLLVYRCFAWNPTALFHFLWCMLELSTCMISCFVSTTMSAHCTSMLGWVRVSWVPTARAEMVRRHSLYIVRQGLDGVRHIGPTRFGQCPKKLVRQGSDGVRRTADVVRPTYSGVRARKVSDTKRTWPDDIRTTSAPEYGFGRG